jgi:hypothetical protein
MANVDTVAKHSVDIYKQLEYDNIHHHHHHHDLHHQMRQQKEGESYRLFPSSTSLISPTRIL